MELRCYSTDDRGGSLISTLIYKLPDRAVVGALHQHGIGPNCINFGRADAAPPRKLPQAPLLFLSERDFQHRALPLLGDWKQSAIVGDNWFPVWG